MRGTRVSWALVAVLVAGCSSEARTPQADEVTSTPPVASPAPTAPGQSATTLVEQEPIPTTSGPAPTLPADDESSTTMPLPLSGSIVLRGDGLGNARFGRPMDEVVEWLVAELGAPVWESVARAPLAASQWYEARDLFRSLTFETGELSTETGRFTALTVLFSDVSNARDDGVVHLAGWQTSLVGTEVLVFPAGLRLGMGRAELEEQFPDLVFTAAPGFEIVAGDSGEAGIRGDLSAGVVVGLEAGIRVREHDEIPAAPPTPEGPVVADLVLFPDGVTGAGFSGPAEDLVATLTDRLGSPAEEINVRARRDDRLLGPLGYFPESELRHLTWYDPGLTIMVADGEHFGGTERGDLRLVFWSTSSNRLRFESGVGVGSTLAELISAHPATTVGIPEECSGAFHPQSFTIDMDAAVGPVTGTLGWDWVSDVQRELNDRGATLAVDGEYGPRTRAAVEAFQTAAAIDPTAPWDSDGWIGPLTLDALGLAAPESALVESLRAGHPGSC